MNTTLPEQTAKDFAAELRRNVIAIQLHRKQIGKSRAMDKAHKRRIAEEFDADDRSISSSKRLFVANDVYIKAINAALNTARELWETYTVGYLHGVRLLNKDRLEDFTNEFEKVEAELREALLEADIHREEILASSRVYLGEQLFRESDYPASFRDSVSICWTTYNFEPSEELLRLAPETYRREQERVRQQFEIAVSNYEQEMKEQLADLIDSLLATLQPDDPKKRVKFAEATTDNLRAFFRRFKEIGITSDSELTDLISQAETALGNTRMGTLKRNIWRKGEVAEKFTAVKERLATMTVDADSRSISLDDLED